MNEKTGTFDAAKLMGEAKAIYLQIAQPLSEADSLKGQSQELDDYIQNLKEWLMSYGPANHPIDKLFLFKMINDAVGAVRSGKTEGLQLALVDNIHARTTTMAHLKPEKTPLPFSGDDQTPPVFSNVSASSRYGLTGQMPPYADLFLSPVPEKTGNAS